MSAYRDKDRGGFDEILHAFASIIKTLHFLGAFAVLYVMMNKIGEDIKQKLKRPAEKSALPAVLERRCPLSNIAQVKTPVRDTFGVCLTDEVRYICDGQDLTARADTIWKVETRSCYEHEKHLKSKSGSPSKKVALTTWIQLSILLAPFAIVLIIMLIWLFNLESIIVWWEEVGSWMNAEENQSRVGFLFWTSSFGGFVAWLIALSLLIQKADTSPSYAVKTPCSTLYFVDGTVMKHVTMLTPAMEFTTITGVQKLDLKRLDSQTACGLTADEMRDLADRLKEVIYDHRYEIARALGVERYNRTVRLLPDLKVYDTET